VLSLDWKQNQREVGVLDNANGYYGTSEPTANSYHR
jgi:hypothetical protein